MSDAYAMGSAEDDFLLTLSGKMVQRKKGGGISADLIGGNPSQEDGGCDDAEDSEQVVAGIDVVLDYSLQDQSEYFVSKKVLQSYIKKWLKNVSGCEEMKQCSEKCEKFKSQCAKKIKAFMDLWSGDASVFSGPEFDPGECHGSIMIGIWDEDGLGLKLYGIRDTFIEEKC